MVISNGKRRARNADDKLERRDDFLLVASRLFSEVGFRGVTMSAVAERAGLAKGTAYLYFPTKEALFLALVERHLSEWFDAVDRGLLALKPSRTAPGRVVALLVDELLARPVLASLLSILHSILEQNLDEERARAFKRLLLARVGKTAPLLERVLPFLGEHGGAHLLIQVQALVVGFGQMASPSEVVAKVLEDDSLAIFRIDLKTELTSALGALLRGLEKEKTR